MSLYVILFIDYHYNGLRDKRETFSMHSLYIDLVHRAERLADIAGLFDLEDMGREFANNLYNSTAWKNTRRDYIKSVGGLCERCMAQGIVKPAELVHHKTPLTPSNIDNMDISLSWDNLQALCRECHAEVHEEIYQAKRKRRYKIVNGRVIIRDSVL